jgi:non-specific serine/threonine protein kinase
MTRPEGALMTIVGPGGIGKTRLMLQAAREVVEVYEHGLWLVELAPLNNSDLIPERVAAVLGVQEQPGRPMRETLAAFLRPKTLLLLLDNVEHLVQTAASFVDYLLPSTLPNVEGRRHQP